MHAGCGGEGGIRTRDGLPRTAFPVRRHSPLGDLSPEGSGARRREAGRVRVGSNVAERAGFEPAVLSHTAFRERHHQPLGHLSAGEDTKPRPVHPVIGPRTVPGPARAATTASRAAGAPPLLSFRGRARRGTSGALYLQSAPAGLNPLPRSPFSKAARRCDVEDRVPRSGEPRIVSDPEGSSTKRSSSGAAERPGPSRTSRWARATSRSTEGARQ